MALAGIITLASVLTFARPVVLLLLAAGAVPVLLARRAARRGHRVAPISVALQCAAVLLAVGALAGPRGLVGPGRAKPVLVFQDVSASCRIQRDREIQLPSDVPVERLAFASSVAADAVGLDANQTHLAPVLRLVAARADGIAGVVIHTDGRFADRWFAAAEALAAADLPAAIVPMASPPVDARVAAFTATRRADGHTELRVSVSANALDRRMLTVTRVHPAGGELLVRRTLDLLGDRPVTITVTDSASASAAEYQARLAPGDTFPENDFALAGTLPKRGTVAVIGPLGEAADALAGLRGMAVRSIDASRVGTDASWWMDFASVVLADANGHLLDKPARAALAQYVRSGGGLVLIGAGPHASPADSNDPLNRVAALTANPYQRKPLRLTVVLDASGSMAEGSATAGRVKFDQAAEAVSSIRRHLTPDDSLSVIAFAADANRIYDSGDGPPDFGALGEALGRVRPGGPTDVGKALDLVVGQAVPAGRDGLVLVVSDLDTKAFDPAGAAEAFRGRGLSLAVVAISGPAGGESSEATSLEALARLLNGSLVSTREDLSQLAKVFADLLRRTRGDALRRGRFPAAVVRETLGMAVGPLPEVRSYLLAAPRADAKVIAQVAGQRDPLMAARQVGMGRSVSLAMPVGAGENPAWRQSGELARTLGRAVTWSLRPGFDARFSVRAERREGRLRLTLDARDANAPINGLELVGRIAPVEATLSHGAETFPIEQIAPGRYEGSAGDSGESVAVEVRSGGQAVVWQGFLPARAPAELVEVGADAASLNRLAELTGGRIVRGRQFDQFAKRLSSARRRALWPILLAGAVAMMLLEWAITRVRRRA